MASREARLDSLRDAADRIPGLLETLERTVERVRRLHRGYRDLHWGDAGKSAVRASTVPDASHGVVVLGALLEIVYVTRKGKRDVVAEWQHEFSRPLPILGVAPDERKQGLVIVRGDSRYTVTERGIVG